MRVLPLAALAGIAAVVCSASAANAANAAHRSHPYAASEHLYVATYVSGQPVIQRFPFVNGLPATTPDLTFDNLTNPMAVGHDGTFYGTVPLSCCYGLGMIDIFPPNSTVMERQITLPNLKESTTIDTALVEGPNAYLYVGYAAFISGIRVPGHHAPKQGVAVYPPNANGGGRPLRMFDVPIDLAGPDALAFDGHGLLYVATTSSDDLHNRVYTVEDLLTGPRVLSALDLASSYDVWGLAFSDGGRNMYALSLGSAQAEGIAVYPYGASGNTPPSRFIAFASGAIIGVGLGIAGPNAYVPLYNAPPSVLAYDKHASGSVSPVYTLPISGTSVTAIAVGR